VTEIRSKHEAQCFADPVQELESTLDRETPEQTEAATSNHLIRLIDFFFALVLGQSIIRFAEPISSPFHSNVPTWLALVTIYYTVIRSFVAWHAAIETRRYRMLVEAVRTTELWRVYIDVAILALYSYMLLTAERLIDDPGANIQALLWAFPVLFLLYDLWGRFRRLAWGPDDFEPRILRLFGLLYTLLALAYTVLPSNALSTGDQAGNVIALSIALILMILYRYINFWQEFPGRAKSRGIPCPKLPRLTVPKP
jgi:hypothetical protein